MKIVFFLFFLLMPGYFAFSQDFNLLKSLEFSSDADYRNFESEILACANYILSVPVSEEPNRTISVQVLIRWMRGTPDFIFELDNTILSLSKNNKELLNIYMAAMTKFLLENRDKKNDPEEITYNAYIYFLDYCDKPDNHVNITRSIRQAIDSKNKGKLRDYLQLSYTN